MNSVVLDLWKALLWGLSNTFLGGLLHFELRCVTHTIGSSFLL